MNFPLHYICRNSQLTPELFYLLMATEAAAARGWNGDYPLHLLLGNPRLSMDLFTSLLRAAPFVAAEKNFDSNYPIHILCRNNNVEGAMVAMLLKRAPEVAEPIVQPGRGNWDALKLEVRKAWNFRFDWYIKSRTPQELGRRCDTLVKLIEKEVNARKNKRQKK